MAKTSHIYTTQPVGQRVWIMCTRYSLLTNWLDLISVGLMKGWMNPAVALRILATCLPTGWRTGRPTGWQTDYMYRVYIQPTGCVVYMQLKTSAVGFKSRLDDNIRNRQFPIQSYTSRYLTMILARELWLSAASEQESRFLFMTCGDVSLEHRFESN